MITPEDAKRTKIELRLLDSLEREIDSSIISNHGLTPYEFATLAKEYSVDIRNAIADRYLKVGWNYVYHGTSSETHIDISGITVFYFSMVPVDCGNFYCLKREVGI